MTQAATCALQDLQARLPRRFLLDGHGQAGDGHVLLIPA